MNRRKRLRKEKMESQQITRQISTDTQYPWFIFNVSELKKTRRAARVEL